MTAIAAILLVLLLLAGGAMTLVGLPGNWTIVAATAAYAFLLPGDSALSISWTTVIVLGALAAAAELAELLAGALGVAKAGGSRRSAVFALVGSFGGSLLGLVVSLPIPVPVIGPLVAVVIFASLGALAGAVLGEPARGGHEPGHRWRVGKAAFWGRLLGTAAKVLAWMVMVIVVVFALVA